MWCFRLLQHQGDMVCGMDFDRPTFENLAHQVSENTKLQAYTFPCALASRLIGNSASPVTLYQVVALFWHLPPFWTRAHQHIKPADNAMTPDRMPLTYFLWSLNA